MGSHSKWFRSIKKTRIAYIPDIETGGIIEKIAAGSPAEKLFLKPGHVLLSVNGHAAATIEINDLLINEKRVVYTFYCPKDSMIIEVETDALPLGIRVISSSDSIVEKYKKLGNYSSDGFVALWEREDYEGLKTAIEEATKDPLVIKLFKKITGRECDNPISELIKCIYDIEAGRGARSFSILEHLASTYDEEFPANLKALIHYYQGIRAHMANDWDEFEDQISQAYKYQNESGRINKITEIANIQSAGCTSMFGRVMPMHYEFKYLEGGKGGVTLQQLLDDLGPDEVMPMCFMPSCRMNATYDEALKVYRSIYPHVDDFVAPLVVITDERRKGKLGQQFEQERLAINSGVPLIVLHEKTAHFAADLEIKSAPVFWAINKTGNVIWDSGLEDAYKYWALRAQAITPTPELLYRYG